MKNGWYNIFLSKLDSPIDNIKGLKKILYAVVFFSTFIALFLIIFKPFNLESISGSNINLKLSGYGIVTMLALLINYFLIPILLPKLFRNWLLYKELIYSFWNLFFIALGNWLYSINISESEYDSYSLPEFFIITLVIGLIPMTIHYLITERKKMKLSINELKLNKGSEGIESSSEVNTLELFSGSKTSILIPLDDLLYIESLGNYCTVFYNLDTSVEKVVIRSSLKSIEEQASTFSNIFRCHKSYIVNLKRISKIDGNTKGYRLIIDGHNFEIPVSRTFSINELRSQLDSI